MKKIIYIATVCALQRKNGLADLPPPPIIQTQCFGDMSEAEGWIEIKKLSLETSNRTCSARLARHTISPDSLTDHTPTFLVTLQVQEVKTIHADIKGCASKSKAVAAASRKLDAGEYRELLSYQEPDQFPLLISANAVKIKEDSSNDA